METRKEIAAEKKRCGSHNCTQSVVCTYHDYTGIDEDTLKNVGNAFAAGMGNMEGTCGALVGAGVVLGLATKDKAKSVKAMRQIMTQFQQRSWLFSEAARDIATTIVDVVSFSCR